MLPTVIAALALALASVSAREKCYDGLPCFSTDKPWKTFLRPIPAPDSPEKVGTHFFLYSRANPEAYQIQAWPEIVLDESSGYNASKPIFFLTHGYFNNGNFTWLISMKNALLEIMDANVIIVDWGKGATKINYGQSVSNTRVVGAELTRLGKYLISNHSADPKNFHLIGHSLGAHVMAYMGKGIPHIGRITALDAAQPGYEGYSCVVRLCVGDADFIQAIHTDAKPFLPPILGVGFLEPIGDVDFYMNEGTNQPGCNESSYNLNVSSSLDVFTLPIELFSDQFTCNHLRSIAYFLSSLRTKNCTFWGHHMTGVEAALHKLTGGAVSQLLPSPNCTIQTCSPMGLRTEDYPARGTFQVKTNQKEPFCILDEKNDLTMAQAMAKYKSTS